jgi:hypothetical protein
MTDQERAESVIRAGVRVEADDFTCIGCGETVTIRVPGRPAGGHGTLVTVDDNGKAGSPVDVWVHRNRKCVAAGVLKVLAASAGDAQDAEPEAEAETPPVAHIRRTAAGTGRRGSDEGSAPATPAEPQPETEKAQ